MQIFSTLISGCQNLLAPLKMGGAFAYGLGLVLLGASLSGCTSNPATGGSNFTPFMAPDEEAEIGAQAHPKILRAYGGAYLDEALQSYVDRIGGRLRDASDLPNQPLTITILDSPVVNAFALPGGYIYVTRGLLALAQNEAEFAAVVAHEMAHVMARHGAQRHSAAMGTRLVGTLFGSIVGGSAMVNLMGQGGDLVLASYSRDQEFEADAIGIRYLSGAGYQASASAAFLTSLGRQSALHARLTNRSHDANRVDWLASHPGTTERIAEARALGHKYSGAPLGTRSDPLLYLSAIDGLLYGDAPEDGRVEGQVFSHPTLKFRFAVPDDFHLTNTVEAVWSYGPNRSLMRFDHSKRPEGMSLKKYFYDEWGKRLVFREVVEFKVDGHDAVSGWTRIDGRRSWAVVIAGRGTQTFQFLFGALPQTGNHYDEAFRHTVESFTLLSDDEAEAIRARIVKIVKVQPGDSVQSLAARMRLGDALEDRFLVLNGLTPGDQLRPGTHVKLIVD